MSKTSIFDLGPERLSQLLSLGKEDLEIEVDDASNSATPPSAWILEKPGSWIGHYRLIRVLGEGGMGVVYLAEQEHPIKRQVALKVIKPGMDSKRVIVRFEAERQVLALLDHPNIAHVYDAGATDRGRPYFAMEHVEGLPITEYCDQQRLTIEDRLRLFLRVCDAIHHAHQKGIIHRDIKATNVLVCCQDGHHIPKVIDFGIAKAIGKSLTEHTLRTEDSQLLGTPEYMSPEQVTRGSQYIDVRSDVYALGMLLYVLLTGVLPFDAEGLRQKNGLDAIRQAIQAEDTKAPSARLASLAQQAQKSAHDRRMNVQALIPCLRRELEWIPLKALEKNRERRYQSVAELALDIRNYLDGTPLIAGPPTALYRMKKFFRRHRTAALVGIVLAIAMACVIPLAASWHNDRIQLSRAEAFAHRSILSETQELFSRRDLTGALERVRTILNSPHVGPEAQLLYASILVEGCQPEEAVARLEGLLTDEAGIAGAAHALLARIYWEGQLEEDQKLSKVASHRQRAESLLPETAEAYSLQALTTPSIKEKLKYLNRALELDPGHYESLKLRAFIEYACKEYDKAKEDARVLIALGPQDNVGYELHGLALRGLGLYEQGAASLTKAIERTAQDDPTLVELHDQRRQTYMLAGAYDKATEDAAICMALDEKSWVHSFHLYCAQTASGRHAAAETTYDQHLAPHRDWLFRRYCSGYVMEMLERGKNLNLPQDADQRAAFLPLVEASEYHAALSSKARRVVSDGWRASWSPDGTKIVYVIGDIGLSGIATYDIVSGRTQLLTVPGKVPYYSPDGKHIAYVRTRSALPLRTMSTQGLSVTAPENNRDEVWVMNADGTGARYLVDGCEPCWSPDSQRICFTNHSSWNRYSISIHKPGGQPVLEARCDCKNVRESPDGRYRAMLREYAVYAVDCDTGMLVRKWAGPPPAGGYRLGNAMTWAPGGDKICAGALNDTLHGVWLYDIAESEPVRIVGGPVRPSGWSRTGKLAITTARPIYDIWIANWEDLEPGCSIDQYCEDMLRFYERRLRVDPNDTVSKPWHAQFKQYVQSRERDWFDRDQYNASPWSNPATYGVSTPDWRTRHLFLRSGDFWISDNGLELYFTTTRRDGLGGSDIWATRRNAITETWSKPEYLSPPINSPGREEAPWLSRDGLCLYLATDRPGGFGNLDIWCATRRSASDPWGKPVNLGADINTEADECYPCLSADGLTLYFSGRKHIRRGSLGGSDLWMTTRQSVSAPWKAPVNLGPWINSSFHERNPFVSRNGLILMFSSNRPGSFSHDIWVSQRASAAEPFGPPIPLSPPVNSTHDETAAFFLEDQTMLYFTTSREGWVSHLAQVPILLTSEVDREDAPPQ